MSSEPPAKKMKEMEESSANDLEFIAPSSTESENVTLDDLVLINCVSQSFLYDHLILKCASRRLAAIIQQQNAVQPVFVEIIDVERDYLDESSIDYSRVFIDRYRSKCSKSRVTVNEEWTIREGVDLERLLLFIFSQFRRFKCLRLQSFKMSALTEMLIYALSAEESFAPLQLDCLAIHGVLKSEVNWYIIKRFSRLIRKLDVTWQVTSPRSEMIKEKQLFWNIIARCMNLRRFKTTTCCVEDFFFFNNKFQVVADDAKCLHVKHCEHNWVVEMGFSGSPTVQENAAASSEVGIEGRKVRVHVQLHVKARGPDYLVCLARDVIQLLPKDLSNVDVGQLFNHQEALLVSVFRFLSYGAFIHVGHCPQFKEMDDNIDNVTEEMFIAIYLSLLVSARFYCRVNLMFLFLNVNNLMDCFFKALDMLESGILKELQIVRDAQKPEMMLTNGNAKVGIAFAPAW